MIAEKIQEFMAGAGLATPLRRGIVFGLGVAVILMTWKPPFTHAKITNTYHETFYCARPTALFASDDDIDCPPTWTPLPILILAGFSLGYFL